MKTSIFRAKFLFAFGLLIISAIQASAQTTEFTYQGKLSDTGTPSATYDFEFRLCNSATDCTTPLATQQKLAVPVSIGVFTVTLDFGAARFDGTSRWLEIAVKQPAQETFTTLTPRQALTSEPYSIKSLKSLDAENLGGMAATQFVQTTDPRLDATNYVQNTNTPQAGVNFNIGGTGTASILDASVQFNLGGNRILTNTGTDNLFAGAGAGAANTTGPRNAFFGRNAGAANTNGNDNAFFGFQAGRKSQAFANSFFGSGAGAENINGNSLAFFGQAAGSKNQSGTNNSFFGNAAGRENTTGGSNTFLGFAAGINNTTGADNIFIGSLAGNPTTTQVSNSMAFGKNVIVSTSNTIVLGTNGQTTRIPGKVAMGSGVVNPVISGVDTQSFNTGSLVGLFTGNVFLYGLDSLLSSPIHLCIRSTALGPGFGGDGLARCTTAFSSAANKTDVKSFSGGLDVIKRLKPVSFKWKADGVSDVGLNAEDVAEVAPQLVTRNDKGKIEDVRENSLNVLFINAFKEQQKQIDAQQEQIKQLRQQFDALTNFVCATNREAEICKEKR